MNWNADSQWWHLKIQNIYIYRLFCWVYSVWPDNHLLGETFPLGILILLFYIMLSILYAHKMFAIIKTYWPLVGSLHNVSSTNDPKSGLSQAIPHTSKYNFWNEPLYLKTENINCIKSSVFCYKGDVCCCSGLTLLSAIFSHITTTSGCNREPSAHFYSAVSLKYHASDTWHDTTPGQIILTLDRPVLVIPHKLGATSPF